jgi:hypothetical protein
VTPHAIVRGEGPLAGYWVCADHMHPRTKGRILPDPVRLFFKEEELWGQLPDGDGPAGSGEEQEADLCQACLEAILRACMPALGVIVEGPS